MRVGFSYGQPDEKLILMKIKIRIIFFLSLIYIQANSQNLAENYKIEEKENKSEICLQIIDGQTIKLNSRFSRDKMVNIEYYSDSIFCIFIFKEKNSTNDGSYVNASFKLNGFWVQDYQDRNLAKLNTGLSTTKINSIKVVDAETLLIDYETTFVVPKFNSHIISTVKLGKFGFYETETKSKSAITWYYDLYGLGKQQKNSPRKKY